MRPGNAIKIRFQTGDPAVGELIIVTDLAAADEAVGAKAMVASR